jgi:rhodanese-related sulfurtransferase
MVLQAVVIGLAANAVNPNRLPWVRAPLEETRRTASSSEVLDASSAKPTARPVTAPRREPPPAASDPRAASDSAGPAAPEPSVAEPAHVDPPTPIEAKPAPPAAAPTPKPRERSAQPASAGKPAPDRGAGPAPVRPAPAKPVEALFTTLRDAKALFDGGQALFVDARHQADYAAEHISGALSLYVDDVEALYTRVLGGVPKDKAVVTYCSDAQCEAAVKLADALVARGHTRVFILLDGLPGWTAAGYPTRAGANP